MATETTDQRRSRLTRELIAKMHRLWHAARGLSCDRLDCEHSWYPA